MMESHMRWKADILRDSSLIKSYQEIDLLSQGLPSHHSFSLKLLYRGTKDGYKAEKYRLQTRDKGPLLILLQNEHD